MAGVPHRRWRRPFFGLLYDAADGDDVRAAESREPTGPIVQDIDCVCNIGATAQLVPRWCRLVPRCMR